MNPYYFALATPVLLYGMGAMCQLTWSHYRRHRYLLWYGANLVLTATAVVLQTLLRAEHSFVSHLGIGALYLAAAACASRAVCQRLGQRTPRKRMALAAAATLVLLGYFLHFQPSIAARITVISVGVAAMALPALPRLWRAAKRHALDHASVLFFTVGTLFALCRPLLLWGDYHAPNLAADSLIWWSAIFAFLLLYVPASICLAGSPLLDAVHTLRRERDHDALTGLLNRRAFEEICSPQPYLQGVRIVVMCDIDHFKRVNDQYGHGVGDDVLHQFAAALRSHLREHDVIARMGGEEFAMALWHTSLAPAQALVQRLVAALPQHTWSSKPAHLQVTASFGVVQVRPTESLAQALQRADALLYDTKHAGRNGWRADDGSHSSDD